MGVRSHPTRKSGSLRCQPQKNLVLEGSRQCRQKDPKRMSSSTKERVACLEWELYYNRLERDTAKGGCRQAEDEKEAAAAAKSLQLCPTLGDPIDGSPPASPIPGTLQAREWSGLPFPSPVRESESEVAVWLLTTPWTVAHQAPLSVAFPWQEYSSGLPLPSPRGGWWSS